MKRSIDAILRSWRHEPRRKPLLIRGARQVGKSYTISQFGQQEFADMTVVNLEAEPQAAEIFKTLDPREILSKLEILSGQTIVPGKSLLFIDEIQAFPNAIPALRYFYEKLPDLHVIAAGSLLELTLNAAGISMPVGRIQYLYMKPMSFEEFLIAMGHGSHHKGVSAQPGTA